MKVRDRILVIADLMLGALHADAGITGEEEHAVREMLAKLLLCTPDELPEEVDRQVRGFSLQTFDLDRAAADFLRDPPMQKRRLLELIAALTDADGTDLREDEYLRDLAHCLGMAPDEYAGVVLDYEIEQSRQSFDEIRRADGIARGGENPRWRRKAANIPRRDSAAAIAPSRPPPIPTAARKRAAD